MFSGSDSNGFMESPESGQSEEWLCELQDTVNLIVGWQEFKYSRSVNCWKWGGKRPIRSSKKRLSHTGLTGKEGETDLFQKQDIKRLA